MANLFREDRKKLINAGFTILRACESEKIIKRLVADGYGGTWEHFEKFKTKSEMKEKVDFMRHNYEKFIFEN